MVKSMTGFGKGEATLQNKKITVEIRSLNSKQLDLGLRLPAVYRPYGTARQGRCLRDRRIADRGDPGAY